MNDKASAKQNVSLIIGLAIPVLMIIFIAAAIYVPRWFTTVEPPKFNFLYVVGNPGPYVQYRVRDGRLTKEQTPRAENDTRVFNEDDVNFHIHDVTDNKSREISYAEAEKLNLDPSSTAPDGYRVEHGRRGGSWFLFFDYGRDYRTRYLVKDYFSQKLYLEWGAENRNYYNFRFIGWIKG